jgi:hypothetical protein
VGAGQTGRGGLTSSPEATRKRDVRSSGRPELLAVLLYGALALVAYLPVWPGQTDRVPWCACDDTAQSIWFLRWTPFALTGGHSLFTSNWIDVGSGINLIRNTSMPLLALLALPLTLTRGPVASFNFLLWLGIASSGTSCFLVLRRAVSWAPAAFVGGLIYAFSSYMAGQGLGHLNLVFVPIPPVLLYVLYELLVRQSQQARRWGIALGLLTAAQFLISAEILIDTAIIAVLGVVILVAAHPKQVAGRLRHALYGGAFAVVAAAPFLAYPLDVYFRGPQRFTGSPWHGSTFSMDLFSSLVPTMNQRITTTAWATIGDRLQPNLTENGGYLGVPLVLLVVFLVVRYRHVALMRMAAAMAVVAWLLTLGPRLFVNGHQTSVPLPFALFLHLPLLNAILAGRFTLFVDLFVGGVVAIGAELLHRDLSRRKGFTELVVTSLIALLMAVALVPVAPRWPYPHVTVATTTPAFFTTKAVDAVPAGAAVLTFPYPIYPENQAMLWQAVSGMRFKILGGYALVPGPDNVASDGPAPVVPATVPTTLIADYTGLANPGPAATPADLRSLVQTYGIQALIVGPGGVDPAAAVALFTQTYGPPQVVGGIDLWSNLA